MEHNIEKVIKTTDRRRVYIAHNDVLMLAELHKRKVEPDISPIDIVEELNEIRSKVRELASEIEDIKHDLKVYVQRSIYIG